MGKSELAKILEDRNPDYGGVGVLVSGYPGCGKTNLIGCVAEKDFKKRIRIAWRGKDTCQWTILLNTKIPLHFWFKEGLKFTLYNREIGRYTRFERFGKVSVWSDPKDLIKKLDTERINVIYTTPHSPISNSQQKQFCKEWLEILDAATKRLYSKEITFLFDEVEDFAPESKSGFNTIVTQAGDIQKELRKNRIHFFGATQRPNEISYKFLNKIPWFIYMTGVKPREGSQVDHKYTNVLEPGQAIIDGQYYQKTFFPFMGKTLDLISNIKVPEKDKAKYEKDDEKERQIQEFKRMKKIPKSS